MRQIRGRLNTLRKLGKKRHTHHCLNVAVINRTGQCFDRCRCRPLSRPVFLYVPFSLSLVPLPHAPSLTCHLRLSPFFSELIHGFPPIYLPSFLFPDPAVFAAGQDRLLPCRPLGRSLDYPIHESASPGIGAVISWQMSGLQKRRIEKRTRV